MNINFSVFRKIDAHVEAINDENCVHWHPQNKTEHDFQGTIIYFFL